MHFQEYRAKGAACVLAAKNSKSPSERIGWLSMADIWLTLAEMSVRHTPLLLEEDAANANTSHQDQWRRLARVGSA